MRHLACAVAVILLTAELGLAAQTLVYRGEVGRVAEYRVTTRITGEQISLGERRPVNVEAEFQVREEVLSSEPDGSFHLQVSGRALSVKDPSRAFAGRRFEPPPTHLHLSPRGEILSARATAEDGGAGLRAEATADLLAQFLPVIMPSGPVESGDAWEWEDRGAKQSNQLLTVTNRTSPVAHVSGIAQAPMLLHARSEALRLTTETKGTTTQTSALDLLVDSGVVLRHKGTTVLQAKTEVRMESPGGPRTFLIELHLRVEFDSRLARLGGQPG